MAFKYASPEFRLGLFSAVFVASVIMSNAIGGKVSEITILGLPIVFSVGIIPFFMTFFILDAVNEVYGRKAARELIWVSVAALVFVSIVTLASVALPFAARSWVKPEQFNPVFDSGLRMMVASIIAFMAADLNDALVFQKLREKLKGKFLWLRSNLSNLVGQTLDTFVFMFLAFWDFFGIVNLPNSNDAAFVIRIALPYLALKLVLSVFSTPFVYAGVKWLRGSEKVKALPETKTN